MGLYKGIYRVLGLGVPSRGPSYCPLVSLLDSSGAQGVRLWPEMDDISVVDEPGTGRRTLEP